MTIGSFKISVSKQFLLAVITSTETVIIQIIFAMIKLHSLSVREAVEWIVLTKQQFNIPAFIVLMLLALLNLRLLNLKIVTPRDTSNPK